MTSGGVCLPITNRVRAKTGFMVRVRVRVSVSVIVSVRVRAGSRRVRCTLPSSSVPRSCVVM